MHIVEMPFTRTNGIKDASALGSSFGFFNFLFSWL